MPEYDFYATLRSDLAALDNELDAEGVNDGIDAVAAHLAAPRERVLAALWRSSKRHGESVGVFVSELKQQVERETARRSGE